jgi:7-cyano-7-deazaguanine synthase in queuosine biosynthesis
MKQYDTFTFDAYEWNPGEGTITLNYSLGDEVHFTETLTLPDQEKFPRAPEMDDAEFDRALFALHIIGGISYYKTCLPKEIVIRSGTLSESEAAFWSGVYENGLGEFFYKNDIDFTGLIKFPFDKKDQPAPELPQGEKSATARSKPQVLVPIGGGKDSLVTLELLKKAGYDVTLFRMGQHDLIDEMAKVADLPLLSVKRALSPALFRLNEEQALNGHVPITAYLSCVTVALGLLYDIDAVALSNERSANEGNVEFHGKEINHQWSKSLAFERAFQDFVEESVTTRVRYFSLLRPLSEVRIAQLMAEYPQYFRFFTSCNANWKILEKTASKRWCGQCPKCAFAFALLAAFLPKPALPQIFKENFFDAPALQPLYRQLFGLEGTKPFECVGTVQETQAAFLLAHRRGDLEDTAAMQLFTEKVLPAIKDEEKLLADAFTPSGDHAMPEEFLKALPKA